ncbi:WD repeat-containing protein 43 [Tripterygium wilfordii]|uniref:WD repeat-containing protein 43 n=1 Tax=Tripterygium wilfordii TaxID=458696 RepID=A0A7J7CXD7_TRIWF|nr:WD repeat-containing protein 43 [Tripterygium wilfordii]
MSKSKGVLVQPLLQLSGCLRLVTVQIDKAALNDAQSVGHNYQMDNNEDEDDDFDERLYREDDDDSQLSSDDNYLNIMGNWNFFPTATLLCLFTNIPFG